MGVEPPPRDPPPVPCADIVVEPPPRPPSPPADIVCIDGTGGSERIDSIGMNPGSVFVVSEPFTPPSAPAWRTWPPYHLIPRPPPPPPPAGAFATATSPSEAVFVDGSCSLSQ